MRPGQWVAIAGGLWLMAAPAVLGYADSGAADVHRTIGPLIATFGTIALWVVARDVRWANVPLAAALALSPVLVNHSASAVIAAVATATLVAVSAPFGGPDRQQRGRGWRGVVTSQQRSQP